MGQSSGQRPIGSVDRVLYSGGARCSGTHSVDDNVDPETEPLVAVAGQSPLRGKNFARSLDFKRLRFVLLSS
jgi:hypothetical protein